MPSWQSFAEFGRELVGLEVELTESEKKKITRAQAVEGQKIARKAAVRDLGGDRKFTNWSPVLDTQIRPAKDGNTLLIPTKSGAGGWTVAQFGRNQGGTTGFLGPGVNTKTGLTAFTKSGNVRKVRSRKARRWNGRTVGKGTASDAIREMDRELPKIAATAVRQVIRKRFDVT